LSVQRCETPQVSVCFCRCDPPLKRDTARARHREQVAVPAGSVASTVRGLRLRDASSGSTTQGAGPWRPPRERGVGRIAPARFVTTGGGRSLRAGLFLPAPLGFLPTPWWLAPDSHQARCHHGHCLRFERCANPGDARTRQAAGPESADAATKTRRLAERRAFVDSRLMSSSVPLQRVAGPRSFTVSPVRIFAPFSSL